MKKERICADIAVFGGSLAGLASAITAKEKEPSVDVVLVEKYFSGYAGKANRGGGVFNWFNPETGQNPEWMVEFQLNRMGRYLNNQVLLKEFWNTLNDNLAQTDRWTGGKKFIRDEHGKFIARNRDAEGFHWSLVNLDLDYLLEIRKYAVKIGVRIIDRVGVADLLTDNGRCVGAVGYHIENGTQYIFQAKAVVLATGSQNFRNAPMWSPGRGEGIAAAWRAGAEMTSCEFATFYQWSTTEYFEPITLSDFDMYAADGTCIAKGHRTKYDPDVDAGTLCEWYIQNRKGNGPIRYLAPDANQRKSLGIAQIRPFADRFRATLVFNDIANKASTEVIPLCIGEMGPVKVDNDFMSSIPGLFCAGDICYGGSRVPGAVPAPPGRTRGSGLPFASFSGRKSGLAAVQYVADKELAPACTRQIAESAARMLAPLSREGGCDPREISREVQRIMNSVGYVLYLKEERMRKALELVQGIKQRLRVMSASDMHGVFAANEAASAVLCVELFLRAALERKESRSWFIREDYPGERDAWLKWIVLKNKDSEIAVDFEEIPFQDYEFQPRRDDRYDEEV